MIKYFCHYKGASTLQGGGPLDPPVISIIYKGASTLQGGGGGSTGSPSDLIDQVLSTWSDSLDSGGSPRPAPV